MKEEIEYNKRPPGTMVIHNYDRKEALRKLTQEKYTLEKELEVMSISQYT